MKEKIKGKLNSSPEKFNIRSVKRIVDTINVIIKAEYFLGIFRFTIVHGSLREPNWKLKILSALIVLICSTLFLLLSESYYGLSSHLYRNFTDSTVINLSYFVMMAMQYSIHAITITFCFNASNICIINMLANMDTMLKAKILNNFYKKSLFQSYIYVLLVVSTQFSITTLACCTLNTSWSLIAGILDIVQRLEIVIFCRYIDLLRQRLGVINNYIKKFVSEQEKPSALVFTIRNRTIETTETINFIGEASESNDKIRDLAKIYGTIGHTSSMVNKMFNFQILTVIMSTFIFIIAIMWTCLKFYRNNYSNTGYLLNLILSTMFWISYIALMSITCERLILLRKETKSLVNKIVMNYDLPTTMRDQAKAFMQLVEAWPLRIHIYDMFSVDITLILKFISVATTYLIVVIQIIKFF
ncbi:hypothetical protein B5X24_HaOG200770 [Helicoverpa armigera]|uniref:Gustatory receptor n=1 Tax=Helicoverpa armigera TaxID=29058 RepID=A0A2W1BNL7_HELAM|nr:hypothetical protein B5X24_HaOG200770 [Helicoverpa armigera]